MLKKNDKIFIAGHNGLIGKSILKFFKKNKFSNIITIEKTKLDLTIKNKTLNFFKNIKPDYVILCAGKVGGIRENSLYPADFITYNLDIQSNITYAAIKYNVKKLIFFGSSCIYPSTFNKPLKEEFIFSGNLEQSSVSYAIAKLAGIQMCLSYNKQLKNKVFMPLIPASVYGPGDNFDQNSSHVLSGLISKIDRAKRCGIPSLELWGSGNPLREFIFVDDIADVCFFLLNNQSKFDYEMPINIGSGFELSINDLAKLISKIIGYKGEIFFDNISPDGTFRKILDSNKLNSLGWKAKVDLKTGIEKTYNWYIQEKINND